MTVLNPSGIAEAVAEFLRNATWTVQPAMVQTGDLSHYPENPILLGDLPAVFVRGLDIAADNELDLGGEIIQQTMLLRLCWVESWEVTDADGAPLNTNVEVLKFERGAELAQVFIRNSGQNYRLDDSVPRVTIEQVTLGKVEFAPQEHRDVSQIVPVQNRRIFAVAMNIIVRGRAARS